MWRQFLEPHFVIIQQTLLGIIDEYGCCYMHRVHEAKSFLHAALPHQSLNRFRDVDKSTPVWNFEPEMLGEAFHTALHSTNRECWQLPSSASGLFVSRPLRTKASFTSR